ncbi:MAG TPA: nuclear transport factor 2 family protein [Pyrinomonadaceae bacterium]|nr:nuclear transport factor 2 family protein [Pyrinomonadaceae bacterium]
MNRNLAPLAIALITLVFGMSACQPAAPDTNRDATRTANANAVKEVVNPVAIEAEIIKLEKDWAAAAQRHDVEAIRRILADDLTMTYPDGTTGTKTSELSDVESGAVTADSWELSDTKVTVLGADAAFITGRSLIKNGKYKDPDTKKAIDISGEYRFTDVYARRNGQWVAVASQTTQIKNPAPAPAGPAPIPKASVFVSPAASPK